MAGTVFEAGIFAVIQTFGDWINLHHHLHFLVTEGGVDEAGVSLFILRMAEEEERRIPAKGWAAMIRKVYEVDLRIREAAVVARLRAGRLDGGRAADGILLMSNDIAKEWRSPSILRGFHSRSEL
jgi:hypothetical protein